MIGSLINAGAILGGGIIGRLTRRNVSPVWEQRFRLLLGAAALYAAAHALWQGVSDAGFGGGILRGVLLLVALIAGRAIGAALGIQKVVNRAGRYASSRLATEATSVRLPSDQAFLAATAIFCLAPLAWVGPLREGLAGDLKPLLIKTAMDGLAMVSLARSLGVGALGAALPVLAGQGTLALWAQMGLQVIAPQAVVAGVNGASGFIILTVALVILGIHRIRMADYLPALLLAPLLFWLVQ